MVIKEIADNKKGYKVKLSQHDHLYVVTYSDRNGDYPSIPVTDLSLALDLFSKLLDKNSRINYN
jgi:hypothetical protein